MGRDETGCRADRARDENVGNEAPNFAAKNSRRLKRQNGEKIGIEESEEINQRGERDDDADQAGEGEPTEAAFE